MERLISRNIGAKAAKGEWLIWFDSDDELVPHALGTIRQRINEIPNDVKGLQFMCQRDSGQISPDPPHTNNIWDYEGYIRWIETHHLRLAEALPVVNRQTINKVLFPEDIVFTSESQYHLDFMYSYKVKAFVDVLHLVHQDANNNSSRPDITGMLKRASVTAARFEMLLNLHGRSIKSWAPKTYEIQYVGMITQLMLSKQRIKAIKKFFKTLKFKEYRFRVLCVILIGSISPRLLAYAKILHARKSQHFQD
jgi:glycosyltransferase involved in cell wall biosynthesis